MFRADRINHTPRRLKKPRADPGTPLADGCMDYPPETAMHIAYPYYLHVPPKPDPIPPGSPPGDLPVDPDTDEPDVDLPPLSPPGKEITPPSP